MNDSIALLEGFGMVLESMVTLPGEDVALRLYACPSGKLGSGDERISACRSKPCESGP